ncbi:MAG: lipoprotein [Gammaproteobacteria bacterium]|nr:lipoprotein [Gammaproteobacteria bacterium]MDH3374491.1 lipoprotein [Gammaproteobacteria bacterium]MDH3409780.1 lipoprotein [Gammaproteobacteria bacterium]MDH3552760.1 lipoprotein [Gammaproteobacteria bacterium]
MKAIICTLAALLLTLTLAACGQSGPLYVPGDPSSIKTQPEAATGDEEDDENDEDMDSQ